jgi:hypothetical protein
MLLREKEMSAVGFEPTSANTVELESTPLDRSGTLTVYTSRLLGTPTRKTTLLELVYTQRQTKNAVQVGLTSYLSTSAHKSGHSLRYQNDVHMSIAHSIALFQSQKYSWLDNMVRANQVDMPNTVAKSIPKD